MNIYFFDKPTYEFLSWINHQGFKRVSSPDDAEVWYVHFRSLEGADTEKLKYVLCPCTNILHLGKVPENVKVIYLDDKKFLFENVRSTAEMTLWGILNLIKVHHDEIHHKTVGIIGMGRIGQQVTQMLQGFNCNVIFYDPSDYWEPYQSMRNVERVDCEQLLKRSDIISIHCTADESTRDLIGPEDFCAMEKAPYFINTARGQCVDGDGLAYAYSKGFVKAFYIDVMDTYSKDTVKKLITLTSNRHNNLITHHKAGKSYRSRLETDRYVYLKLLEVLRND